MDKKNFDVQRLKRRISTLLIETEKSDDLFDMAYSFALHHVLDMIESIEYTNKELIHKL